MESDAKDELDNQDSYSTDDGLPSDSSPSISYSKDANSCLKGKTEKEPVYDAHNPPSSSYNNDSDRESSNHWDGYLQADVSFTDTMQSDGNDMAYYLPSYDTYASGTLVHADGSCVGQKNYFSSSGYLRPPVSHGSEAVPCYPWGSEIANDASNARVSGIGKSGSLSTNSTRSNALNFMITNKYAGQKHSKSIPSMPPVKSVNKVAHLGTESRKWNNPSRRLSFTNQKQLGCQFEHGSLNLIPTTRTWNGNDRYSLRGKPTRPDNFEGSNEPTRGPRAHRNSEPTRGPRAHRNSTPSDISDNGDLEFKVLRDQYNIPEFRCDYKNAKFYVIKSFSEDNVHKCIKYDVWSSTPHGNKKLDAAFHEAEARVRETGSQYPIFLFFSVNASGQFMGCAEMVGKVDFNKDMDFWQLDKWSGFFPVKWHIIKDIPNSLLKHIILENNDKKPVTHTRDTHEIGLKQGLEMLKIFKEYCAKTSVLDDYNFYENREKSLYAKRSNKPETSSVEGYETVVFHKNIPSAEREIEWRMRNGKNSNPTSVVNLTKNLSINAVPVKSSATRTQTVNSFGSFSGQ